MKKPPPWIGVPSSAMDITAEVRKLFKAAGVGDRVPTPKADILACAQLIETGELDLEGLQTNSVRPSPGKCSRQGLRKTTLLLHSRAQGRLCRHLPSPQGRKNFVTYHEITHRVSPWQRSIFATDDQFTLDPRCEDAFEAEANFGAAEILFQGDRFETEARDFPIGLQTISFFAERYDASYHATFRRLVERSDRPCLLLVLKRARGTNENG